jgi:phage tail sheath protein FI
VVFEPNDFKLWKSIRRDVGAFLTRIWRGGALFGRTPEEAFFVKCDEETNTPEEIDAGRVITVVGMAPVKPAEFVIFRIGQHAAGTQVE